MLLSLIISVLATFTVQSNKSVSSQGAPDLSQAVYANSYQKSQIPAGHQATLTLSGWLGCEIESVTLHMRSNTSSGAGNMLMMCGLDTCWSIPTASFRDAQWAGAFSSQDVAISHEFSPALLVNGDISIRIAATQNSLYIDSYEIRYQPARPVAHTVTFSCPQDDDVAALTESSPGAGVVLPSCEWQREDMVFVGWTFAPVRESSVAPAYYVAGERFYPQQDTELYALFTRQSSPYLYPSTSLQSGDYILVNPYFECCLSGAVTPTGIATDRVTVGSLCEADGDTVYVVGSFLPNEQNTYYLESLGNGAFRWYHPATNSYVGYASTMLNSASSVWYLLPDSTGAVWLVDNPVTPSVWLGYSLSVGAMGDSQLSFRLLDHPLAESGLLLYEVPMEVEALFTTSPELFLPIVEVPVNRNSQIETSVRIGVYELRVKNGEKVLMLP